MTTWASFETVQYDKWASNSWATLLFVAADANNSPLGRSVWGAGTAALSLQPRPCICVTSGSWGFHGEHLHCAELMEMLRSPSHPVCTSSLNFHVGTQPLCLWLLLTVPGLSVHDLLFRYLPKCPIFAEPGCPTHLLTDQWHYKKTLLTVPGSFCTWIALISKASYSSINVAFSASCTSCFLKCWAWATLKH